MYDGQSPKIAHIPNPKNQIKLQQKSHSLQVACFAVKKAPL
tara:strand:- start:7597 stop:7719 length:123 start_codon:yes stop_codon:yes gene_type:complete